MKITNKHGAHESVVESFKRDEYDGHDSFATASTLHDSVRIFWLFKKHYDEIERDVSDLTAMQDGTDFHDRMERHNRLYYPEAYPDIDWSWRIENRLEADVLGVTISGKYDLIDPNNNIIDYKNTKIWDIIMDNTKASYERQLNILAWLVQKNYPDLELGDLYIQYKLKDHSRTQADRDRKYPQSNLPLVKYPKWSFEEQDRYVHERVQLFIDNKDGDDSTLPPCTEEEVWASPTTYAVMKHGRKSALRVLDSYEEAGAWMRDNKGDYIDTRQGEWKRCKTYCPVARFCSMNPYRGEI